MLGLGEACLLPILGIEARKRGGGNAAVSAKVALVGMGMLAVPLVWRIYVLVWRPELLGRYTEVKGGRGAGGAGTRCK